MSTFTAARDPRRDPRDGDEIRMPNGDVAAVLLVTFSGVTYRLSFEGRTITATLTGWREFASAGEVTKRSDE